MPLIVQTIGILPVDTFFGLLLRLHSQRVGVYLRLGSAPVIHAALKLATDECKEITVVVRGQVVFVAKRLQSFKQIFE